MESHEKIVLVIDTNWYISATINRNSRRKLHQLISNKRFRILYSKELVQEYKDVIQRSKFSKIIGFEQAGRFFKLIISQLHPILIKTIIPISRDPKDNYLLAMAIDGDAGYLITGDPDLLVLKQIGKTEIIRMGEFLSCPSIRTK